MSTTIGRNITPDSSSTLQQFLDMNLEKCMADLESISGAASKEYSLEKAMDRMQVEWSPMEFSLIEYRFAPKFKLKFLICLA